MEQYETCSLCTNHYLEKEMIWDNGIWLCKQCDYDLNKS